uniref:Uncharacterized protein n=1 Tax=Onchocerca volvulus TaxID=6282 RepID=A0A8R1TVH9_ONCVO
MLINSDVLKFEKIKLVIQRLVIPNNVTRKIQQDSSALLNTRGHKERQEEIRITNFTAPESNKCFIMYKKKKKKGKTKVKLRMEEINIPITSLSSGFT